MMSYKDIVEEYAGKIQYLVDAWPTKLEDNGITFPDGDFWPKSGTLEYDMVHILEPEGE